MCASVSLSALEIQVWCAGSLRAAAHHLGNPFSLCPKLKRLRRSQPPAKILATLSLFA